MNYVKSLIVAVVTATIFSANAGNLDVGAVGVISNTCSIGTVTNGVMTLGNGLKLLSTSQAGGSLAMVPITVTGGSVNVSLTVPSLKFNGSAFSTATALASLYPTSNATGTPITMSAGATGTLAASATPVNYYVDLSFTSASNFSAGTWAATSVLNCWY